MCLTIFLTYNHFFNGYFNVRKNGFDHYIYCTQVKNPNLPLGIVYTTMREIELVVHLLQYTMVENSFVVLAARSTRISVICNNTRSTSVERNLRFAALFALTRRNENAILTPIMQSSTAVKKHLYCFNHLQKGKVVFY